MWLYNASWRHIARALFNSELKMSSLHYVWPLNQSGVSHGPWICCSCLAFLQLSIVSISCFLSSSARSVLAARVCNAPALPSTSSVLCNILQCLAQTVDSQRCRKCFYIKASFASHSWCGGGPRDTAEGGWEAGICRATTVRFSRALVPLGRTCILWRKYFMNDLPYSSLIFKRNIISLIQGHVALFFFFFGPKAFSVQSHGVKQDIRPGWCNLRVWWESNQ